ncbi:unnamed protein product [Lactuca virosa]|uniref:BHLH domain-containing protein n=1 Tax=Lactuca virosa TaxID=75947 RepID=A0AAU9PB10_9ASTR|nr:unnamed protein product [Lactuca virosa]
MANSNPSDGSADDFFEQILGFPAYPGGATDPNLAVNEGGMGGPGGNSMMLQLSSAGDVGSGHHHLGGGVGVGVGGGGSATTSLIAEFPLRVSKASQWVVVTRCKRLQIHQLLVRRGSEQGEARPQTPTVLAERLRRERIAERIRALQELVPSVNKTDRAAMLDEIVDYVKFLRLQVKVLSMSRLGGASAVAPLVTDIPISSVEEEAGEGGRNQPAWEKWSNDGTERQVAKLMEENVGAAMQFLQSKALCIMPISLASAIYHTQPPDSTSIIKPESEPPL